MPELTISHKGLELRGPAAGKLSDVPTQAFPFIMGRDVLENILACAGNGGDLQLALGETPTLHFGDSSHRITPPPKDYQYDLYITKPYEFTRSAQRIPDTMGIFFKNTQEQQARERAAVKKEQIGMTSKAPSKPLPTQTKGRKTVDSDIKTLQSALAAAEAGKSHTGTLQRGNKLLGAAATSKTTPKSHPASPGLSAQASPSTNPFSATQQALERAKDQRFAIVHELAIKDQFRGNLQAAWSGRDIDFLPTLDKVADYNSESRTYSMKRNYWKELDVWKYDYSSKGDRQSAIDNAIRQYNRMRLAHSESQWQKLLPMEERGKGKHPSPSNTKTQSTEDGGATSDSRTERAGSVRSTTPTASMEAKKLATDARLKQIISKTGKKAAAPAKPAPPKPKEKVAVRAPDKERTKRVLSAETVDDSDSADEALPKKKPVQRTKPAATSATAATASKARGPVASKPAIKAAGKSVAKPVAAKRPREDDGEVVADDTSSSSSAPLSKRAKVQPKPKLVPTSASASNPRSSDSSQASRQASNGASRVTASQPKNTSPVKSSPLATSPPTNASDIERQRVRDKMRDLEYARRQKDGGNSRKRKAEAAESQPPSKRPAVQQHTLDKASKFQILYTKYIDLDTRIRCMDGEPPELVSRLIRMHDELTALKTDIYAESAKA